MDSVTIGKNRSKTFLTCFLVALGGCATTPPPASVTHVQPAVQHLAAKKPAQPSAEHAKATTEPSLCTAATGQTQAWLRALLETDKQAAGACLSAHDARSCWSGIANTLTQQAQGLNVLPGDCDSVQHLRHLGTAYLRSAEEVARDCVVRGAPACLHSPAAQKTMQRRKVLEQAIGLGQ